MRWARRMGPAQTGAWRCHDGGRRWPGHGVLDQLWVSGWGTVAVGSWQVDAADGTRWQVGDGMG